MNKKTLDKFEINQEKHLFKTLIPLIDNAIRKKKGKISYLRFAKPTKNGWFFLNKKKNNFNILDFIVNKTFTLHRECCSKGKIAHLLSRLVNLSQNDFSTLKTLV